MLGGKHSIFFDVFIQESSCLPRFFMRLNEQVPVPFRNHGVRRRMEIHAFFQRFGHGHFQCVNPLARKQVCCNAPNPLNGHSPVNFIPYDHAFFRVKFLDPKAIFFVPGLRSID